MAKRTCSVICLLLTLLLVLGACTPAADPGTPVTPTAPPSGGQATPPTGATTGEQDIVWPERLTYWSMLDPRIAAFHDSLSTVPAWVVSQERFGVEIEFIHPPAGMENEQFRVLIAGRDLPDIIEHNWLHQYPGGPARAISDGVIIDLTPLKDAGHAPNLVARINEFDAEFNLRRDLMTANGEFYVFPGLRGPGLIEQNPNGPFVRQDWLDELGLDIPVTVEDWDIMLRRFQSEMGATTPLTWQANFFMQGSTFAAPFDVGHIGATAINHGLFVDRDGIIRYSGLQPGFRQYLELMAGWYRDGLIGADFPNQTTETAHNDMVQGISGSAIGQNDSTLAVLRRTMIADDNNVELVGVPFPKLNAGDPPLRFFRWDQFYTPGRGAAITTSNRYPEATAMILDWWYGQNNEDEGYMVWNFGIEGESFIIEPDGNIIMGPSVTDNPRGMDLNHARTVYMLGSSIPPGLRDVRVVSMQRTDPAVIDATTLWAPQDRSAHIPHLSFTADEGAARSRLLADINSLADESFQRFIMGHDSLDNFDNFIAELHRAGIEDLLEIYNAAYQRWLALG